MDRFIFASIQKERLFLRLHFESKKKSSSAKVLASKIRKIDDNLLLEECKKLG